MKLERRLAIQIVGGPDVSIRGDADQLDELLIHLLKNAVEATMEKGGSGGVRVRWSIAESELGLIVKDDGPGVSETANIFVPFFTTKPGGSGIGLALARQIAEAHGGEVSRRMSCRVSGYVQSGGIESWSRLLSNRVFGSAGEELVERPSWPPLRPVAVARPSVR